MRTATEFVSAFTSGILGSLGLILAVDLGLIFFLALGEIGYNLFSAGQTELALLIWIPLFLAVPPTGRHLMYAAMHRSNSGSLRAYAVGIRRKFLAVVIQPGSGSNSIPTGRLNLLPLALPDAFALFTAVAVAHQLNSHNEFPSPLLHAAENLLGY